MPRRDVAFVQGAYYHIYNRGARRVSIFREARNYAYLTRLMQRVAKECHLTVVAYCLLPNHYHWLIRQDSETPAGMLPRRVFGSYSQAYNRAYNEQGTLFQGPYAVRCVDNDAYIRHLCRYIHANPVKHGIVTTLDAWPYSDYCAWVASRGEGARGLRFVDEWFGSSQQYTRFVGDYLASRALLANELRHFEDELES